MLLLAEFKNTKANRMADIKTKPTAAGVAGFAAAVADETRRKDAKRLAALMQRASGEKPKMWGAAIIGFGSYHYVYESGREGDMPLVGFSPRKAATVLYVHTAFEGAPALLGSLGKHTGGTRHQIRRGNAREILELKTATRSP
jgi:hypothetical protein